MRDRLPACLDLARTTDDTVWFEWDSSETPDVAVAVVEAVAAATDADRNELAPLHHAVDADALASLATDADDVRVTFVHWDCRIQVVLPNTIVVAPDRRRD